MQFLLGFLCLRPDKRCAASVGRPLFSAAALVLFSRNVAGPVQTTCEPLQCSERFVEFVGPPAVGFLRADPRRHETLRSNRTIAARMRVVNRPAGRWYRRMAPAPVNIKSTPSPLSTGSSGLPPRLSHFPVCPVHPVSARGRRRESRARTKTLSATSAEVGKRNVRESK